MSQFFSQFQWQAPFYNCPFSVVAGSPLWQTDIIRKLPYYNNHNMLYCCTEYMNNNKELLKSIGLYLVVLLTMISLKSIIVQQQRKCISQYVQKHCLPGTISGCFLHKHRAALVLMSHCKCGDISHTCTLTVKTVAVKSL